MNKIIIFFMLMLIASVSFAQKASIKGIVIDSLSGEPMEHATVAIVNAKDTSLISYTITQKNGSFLLSGLPTNIGTKLIISMMAYNTLRQTLSLKPGESKNLGKLALDAKNLNEVVVRAERTPIIMKKDTIEFNTETFKTRPNAVVEDLLRLLPGVQVNYDGTIFINGKEVSKLLIDGKRFFGTDPKVATRNLDADMLDKIQVYDDREEDPDHKLSDMEVGKIINLKMKSKIKKSTMGKVYAGMGSRGRHEMGGILSNFRDTLQVSLIGLANNLNKTGFSSNELYTMGGFDRSGGSQAWDGTFGSSYGGGIESVASAGLNINNNYGEKLKMNLSYFYTNTIRDNSTKTVGMQTLTKTIINTESTNISRRDENKHGINGLIEWVPDTVVRVRYDPHMDFVPQLNTTATTGNSANTQGKLAKSFGNTSSKVFNTTFSHNFSYYTRLKRPGDSFTLNHSLSLSKNGSDDFNYSNVTSYVASIASYVQDRNGDNDRANNSGGISETYNRQFTKKLNGEFLVNTRYMTASDQGFVYDRSPSGLYDLLSLNLSKNLDRNTFIQNLRPLFSYAFTDKLTIRIGLDGELQYVINKFSDDKSLDIAKRYYSFFPIFRLNARNFSIDYSERLQQPQIDQMVPIERKYSDFYRTIGNPGLIPSKVRALSVNFSKYDYNHQLNMSFYSGFNFTENNVVQKTTKDGTTGAQTQSYVNQGSGTNAYFGGNLGKQFKKTKKWQIGISTNFNGNYNHRAFFLNADQGTQSNYSVNVIQNINFNYNSTLSFNTNYALNSAFTNYSGVAYAAVTTLKHTVGTDVSLRWPARIIFDARYGYSFNPQVAAGFPKSSNIVNLAITLLMLKKDRGQLKISVYDLLDQNIAVTRYAGNNSVSTTEQQILKRYFLINYQYKLSVYKSK
ncbi:outer membrane beta-barrel protein [Mucilaginibacter sp. UYCu711]|uniref:outer membrane beta-barrel protein n=1 Tax=Mucilaginibacter sp. UYCu711 TaxID=3156339 RepID=UPI003D217A54